VVSRGGADMTPTVLARFMGIDAAPIEKARAYEWAMGAILAAPTGTTIFLQQWDPGITIEMQPGPTMLGLMDCASSGLVWVGSDQAVVNKPLDLAALRKPIIEWAKKGYPARERPQARSLYKPKAAKPAAAAK
jgi:hypothetical protein